jgi:hypothetical protein
LFSEHHGTSWPRGENSRFVFGKSRVQISVRKMASEVEDHSGFSQSFQANGGTVLSINSLLLPPLDAKDAG